MPLQSSRYASPASTSPAPSQRGQPTVASQPTQLCASSASISPSGPVATSAAPNTPRHSTVLPQLQTLLHRAQWKGDLLLQASQFASQHGQHGLVQLILDINEWYAVVEKFCVLALSIGSITVPRTRIAALEPRTDHIGDEPGDGEVNNGERAFFATGRSTEDRLRILGAPRQRHKSTNVTLNQRELTGEAPSSHAYHENVLTLIAQATSPLCSALGGVDTQRWMHTAKDIRNSAKDVVEGRRDAGPLAACLGQQDLAEMLQVVCAGLQQVLEEAKAHLGIQDGEAMDWKGVAGILGLSDEDEEMIGS